MIGVLALLVIVVDLQSKTTVRYKSMSIRIVITFQIAG